MSFFAAFPNEAIHILPDISILLAAYDIKATFCDASKPNISRHSAGPRVDGYMFVTDAVGMQVWLEAGQQKNFSLKEEMKGLQEVRAGRNSTCCLLGLSCHYEFLQITLCSLSEL